MDENKHEKRHSVQIQERRILQMTGVLDVRSFDDHEILLETECGMLLIRGTELHIGRLTLNQGEIDITGQVDNMAYSEIKGFKKSGESVMKRLFH